MKKTNLKNRIIASVLSVITVFSISTIAITSASAASAKPGQIIKDAGLAIVQKYVPGGGVISPVLKAIIGLVSQDDGPSIADISKDISDMRYEIKTQFEEVKKQMAKDTAHIESKIVDQTVLATKGSTFDDLLVALKETADQIETIQNDTTLTNDERAVEINGLIGKNTEWNNKNNFFFGLKSLQHILSDSTFSDTEDRDMFTVVLNDFEKQSMFRGEAMNKATPYISRLTLLDLYAYSISTQCLSAAKTVSKFTPDQVKKLSSIERTNYKRVSTLTSIVNREIDELENKTFDLDRKDSVMTHLKNFAETNRTVLINQGQSNKAVSNKIICRRHVKETDIHPEGIIAKIFEGPLLINDINTIVSYVKSAYPGKSLREYLSSVGFDMSSVAKNANLFTGDRHVKYKEVSILGKKLWWERIGVYSGIDVDSKYLERVKEIEIYRRGVNDLPLQEYSDWNYSVDGYIAGFAS